ncbi:MAG: hypothetical protein ACK50J_01980, partial [Planctomyces sp.]
MDLDHWGSGPQGIGYSGNGRSLLSSGQWVPAFARMTNADDDGSLFRIRRCQSMSRVLIQPFR